MFKEKYENYNPIANKNQIIQGNNYRITILTSKLIRLEYSKNNNFEDNMTKFALNRFFPKVNYKIIETNDNLKIITDDVTIRYNKKEFSSYGLSIELNGKSSHPYKEIWHYEDQIENLGGTIRTLDFIDGVTNLGNGILSKYGISVIDDSNSPILLENGWYKERESNDIDLYVFAYKRNYLEALNDFYKLSGKQPKIPRFALGNWWSRYYPYNEKTYIDLLNKFEKENLPFSVAVIDMDWHLTDIPEKYGSSWTGYTWNTKLFPNPEKFLKEVKNKGYAITLNIHPSQGIRPFEEMYKDFCKDLKLNFENEETIDFDYKSELFFKTCFKYLHYPNEKIGVDFWWIDWQQSPRNIDENKDPLWILNHYYYNDNQKNNNLGLTFSRYSGPGSHRYPIGFSGDTVISWDSLDFQPYFTICASNIGYGWWSHDIGGHRQGIKDNELMLRWLQFGVFSPINRLHSANSIFLEKEPWNFPEPYQSIIKEYLQFRHRLIPYIYTMNIISYEKNIPLIRPLYYFYPENDESYEIKNQYFFGSELMICPITKKINEDTLTADFKMWFPNGNWYDLQNGLKYKGNRKLTINRSIENIGIFFKEGAIIPFSNLKNNKINDISNPENLELIIGTGKDGKFILMEDNIGYEKIEEKVITKFEYNFENNLFIINEAIGNLKAIPKERNYILKFYGQKIDEIELNYLNTNEKIIPEYDKKLNLSKFQINNILVTNKAIIKITKIDNSVNLNYIKINKIISFLKLAQMNNLNKDKIYKILTKNNDNIIIISEIINLNISDSIKNVILEILLA